MIKIRYWMVALFGASLVAAAYMGFSLVQFSEYDKIVHFATFFLLTAEFYYVFDVSTHSLLRMLRYGTIFVCTFGGGVFLEVVQSMINPARVFDYYDIMYNVAGSGTALVAVTVYDMHRFKKRRQHRARVVEVELEEATPTPGTSTPPPPSSSSSSGGGANGNGAYRDFVNIKMNDLHASQ